MSNTIKWSSSLTWEEGTTNLEIFKADQGLSVLDINNLTYVDIIPATQNTYEDINGVEGEAYRVAPEGEIDIISPEDITATFTYSISGA